MNIESIILSIRSLATIVPADPLSSGTFQIGQQPLKHNLGDVNQVYSLVVEAQDADATLDVNNGTLSGGGAAVVNGGEGENADGVALALTDVHALHVRNTGQTVLTLTVENWTGGTAPFSTQTLGAGAESCIVVPAGVAVADAQVKVETDSAGGAWELLVLGKQ